MTAGVGYRRLLVKARLQLNFRKTTIMRSELYNFSVDHEETAVGKDFLYLVSAINPNEDFSQVIRQKLDLEKLAMKEPQRS